MYGILNSVNRRLLLNADGSLVSFADEVLAKNCASSAGRGSCQYSAVLLSPPSTARSASEYSARTRSSDVWIS